jgi:hypothetical protein
MTVLESLVMSRYLLCHRMNTVLKGIRAMICVTRQARTRVMLSRAVCTARRIAGKGRAWLPVFHFRNQKWADFIIFPVFEARRPPAGHAKQNGTRRAFWLRCFLPPANSIILQAARAFDPIAAGDTGADIKDAWKGFDTGPGSVLMKSLEWTT